MKLVEWKKTSERRIFLCAADGTTLAEVPMRSHLLDGYVTAYASSEDFRTSGVQDLAEGQVEQLEEMHPVLAAIREAVKEYVRERLSARAQASVARWKKEEVYPYNGEPDDPIETVEREVFDIVAVQVDRFLPKFNKAPKSIKKAQFMLLRRALESHPDEVAEMLDAFVTLPAVERKLLSDLLKRTTLSNIIRATKIVDDRLHFSHGLEAMLVDPSLRDGFLEREHLHELLTKNTWIFGDAYALTASDNSLTEAVRRHVEKAQLDVVVDEPIRQSDGRQGRLDLMFTRALGSPAHSREHLVVELKRPTVKGGEEIVSQVKKYGIRLPGPGQEPGHRAAGSAHSGRYMGMRPSRQRYDQDTLRPERDPRDARRIQELEQENTELRKERDRWKQRSEHLQGQLDAARRAGCRQAAPFAKNRPQGRGGRPGRKAGEAYGRQGRRARPAQVDETYAAPVPAACPDCGGAVDVTGVASQYQEELPAVRPVVRRFDIEVGHCSRCQRRVQGRHALQTSDALGAAGAQLGPGVVALVVELHTEMGVPLAKVAHVLRTTFGLQVTPGGLAHLLHRTARDAAPTYTALCEQVRNSPVVTPDETGWRVAAISHWLWAFVTPETTVYAICPGRGFDDATTVLGADFAGVLVRDGWVSYRCYRAALHQSCLNHLLRRCKELQEDHPDSLWAGQVQAVLQTGLAVRDRCNDGELSEHGLASVRGRLVAQLGRLIDAPPPLDDAERFARHLATEFAAVFLFLWDLSVDATNWRAEQAIRPAVVIRKVCGGNRTRHGADSQQVLASVVRTARQRDLDLPPLIATMLRATGPVVPDAFGLPPPPA